MEGNLHGKNEDDAGNTKKDKEDIDVDFRWEWSQEMSAKTWGQTWSSTYGQDQCIERG